jgi:hypothetical protein
MPPYFLQRLSDVGEGMLILRHAQEKFLMLLEQEAVDEPASSTGGDFDSHIDIFQCRLYRSAGLVLEYSQVRLRPTGNFKRSLDADSRYVHRLSGQPATEFDRNSIELILQRSVTAADRPCPAQAPVQITVCQALVGFSQPERSVEDGPWAAFFFGYEMQQYVRKHFLVGAGKFVAVRDPGDFREQGQRVAEVWGELLAVLDKHIDDAGLAATARSHGLVLVTRNTKDFLGRGVPLLNPYKSPPERLA